MVGRRVVLGGVGWGVVIVVVVVVDGGVGGCCMLLWYVRLNTSVLLLLRFLGFFRVGLGVDIVTVNRITRRCQLEHIFEPGKRPLIMFKQFL